MGQLVECPSVGGLAYMLASRLFFVLIHQITKLYYAIKKHNKNKVAIFNTIYLFLFLEFFIFLDAPIFHYKFKLIKKTVIIKSF